MKRNSLAKLAILGVVLMPGLAFAQDRMVQGRIVQDRIVQDRVIERPAPGVGFGTGAATGAIGGAIVGGPVGAAVGGAAGALVGGIADSSQPRFHRYVEERRIPSYRYSSDVVVGAELPRRGIRTYSVPREFGAVPYRYTVVNHRTVLVDPETGRIVQVIDEPDDE